MPVESDKAIKVCSVLSDYECQTTFWKDFSIEEHFGEEAVRDTYRRAKAEEA